MKSHWIEHKGKRIFYADYSNFGGDSVAVEEELKEASALFATEPDKSMLVLVNLKDSLPTYTNLGVLRKYVPDNNRAIRKRAVIGLSLTYKVFMTTFANALGHTRVQTFDSQEDALDWLVEESK
jgi:hypothetical protein